MKVKKVYLKRNVDIKFLPELKVIFNKIKIKSYVFDINKIHITSLKIVTILSQIKIW